MSSSRGSSRASSPSSIGPYSARRLFGSPSIPDPLKKITLENVLAGDTCSPIGCVQSAQFSWVDIHVLSVCRLADFEAYLSFVERSLENLQFVVWYQSYRARFFALPDPVRALSPGASQTQFSFNTSPDPSSIDEQLSSFRSALHSVSETSTVTPLSPTARDADHPLYQDAVPSSPPLSPTIRMKFNHDRVPASPFHAAPGIPLAKQPGRAECARIIATFFQPGAPKELSLDSDIRDAVLRGLAQNTHPDVFMPAYEAVFHALQTTSLRHFLAQVATVTNRPKQIFWYAQGMIWIVIGCLTLVLCIAFAHWGHFRARALRLVAAVPIANGVGMIWTGSKGFCLKVGGRGHVQLRSWELEHADSSTHEWWAGIASEPQVMSLEGAADPDEKVDDVETGRNSVLILQPGEVSRSAANALGGSLAAVAARRARKRREALLVDISLIAPFTSNTDRPTPKSPVMISFTRVTETTGEESELDQKAADSSTLFVAPTLDDGISIGPSEPSISQSSYTQASSDNQRSRRNSRNGFRSPPVFGPEKVVLDPRILAIHQQVNKEILLCMLVTFIVSVHAMLNLFSDSDSSLDFGGCLPRYPGRALTQCHAALPSPFTRRLYQYMFSPPCLLC
jgi:hypothetical protein